MLRGSDEDGIERRIVEHLTVVCVALCVRRQFGCVGEAARVDIGERCEFRPRAGNGLPPELRAPVANADDAYAEPFVCAENSSSRETTGETRGHVADEVSSGLHGLIDSSLACSLNCN